MKLVLGTVQFGLDYGINNSIGKPDYEAVKQILDTASDLGITELDTAEGYGDACEILDKYLAEKKVFKVLSKFIWNGEDSVDIVVQKAKNSIQNTDIDGLYFHRIEDYHKFSEINLVSALKDKVNVLGVSLYDLKDLEIVISDENVDIIQLPFNLLDCSSEKVELLKQARTNGKKIYIRSVFLQGIFFKSTLPPKLQALEPAITYLKKLCAEADVKMEELALSFVNQLPFIDSVLIGVDNREQLVNNVQSLNKEISQDIITKIMNINIESKELLNPSNWS